MRNFRKILMITTVLGAICGTALAEEQQIILPEPEIEQPVSYVERKLAEFRARLAELKKQRGDAGDAGFDANATLDGLFNTITESQKDLVLNITGDESVFDPVIGRVLFEGLGLEDDDKFFITVRKSVLRLSFRTPFGGDPSLVAADTPTVVAFSLPYDLSLVANVAASILRTDGDSICIRRDHNFDADKPCPETAQPYKRHDFKIDLRQDQTRTGVNFVFDNIEGPADGSKLNVSGVGPASVTAKFDWGLIEEIYNRRTIIGGRSREKVEITGAVTGIIFENFGLAGIDFDQPGVAFPPLDTFVGGLGLGKRDELGGILTMRSAARPPIPRPVASYSDSDEPLKYDGLERFRGGARVNATLKNFGPLDDNLRYPSHALPGASEVEWRLNGAFEVTHTFTLNKVSVEIAGLKGLPVSSKTPRFFNGQEFEARIHIDGPVSVDDVSGYGFNWQGNVIWSEDDEELVENEGSSLITRKFVSDSNDRDADGNVKRPEVQFIMTSPEGDIFHYIITLDDTAVLVAGINQSAQQGAEAVDPSDFGSDIEVIDTFFPPSFPTNPSKLTVSTNFRDTDGNVLEYTKMIGGALASVTFRRGGGDVFGANSSAGSSLKNSMLVTSNTGFLKRASMRAGIGVFSVEPKIGAAEITNKLTQDNGGLLRALTGADAALESEPITVTSNALRLIREETGYRLIISGYADMSRYNAVWPGKGLTRQRRSLSLVRARSLPAFSGLERLWKK